MGNFALNITRKNIHHWFKLLFYFVGSSLRGLFRRGNWRKRLLDDVIGNAVKEDVKSILAAVDGFAKKERFMMNVGPEKGAFLRMYV